MGQAARSGDYDLLGRLTRWARTVGELVREAANAEPSNPDPGVSRLEPASRPTRRKPRGTNSAYPKFVRRKDQLIKIGWSKKSKREYQHKSPQSVTACVCDALIRIAAASKLFSTEELFPVFAPDDTEIPSYQAYLCLAWLRHEGLVTKEGRQGYAVPDPKNLVNSAVEPRWLALPEL